MSDVERLTANNQARLRYAAEVARQRSEVKRLTKEIRREEARRRNRRQWMKQGAFLCNFLAGWLCGFVGYFAAVGSGPAGVLAFLLAVLAILGGIALDEGLA